MVSSSIGIAAAAYRLPGKTLKVRDLLEQDKEYVRTVCGNALVIPKLRDATFEEVEEVRAFEDEPSGQPALEAIGEALDACGQSGEELSLIVDYSTASRDTNGLSLCYRVQDRIGATDALTVAIGNGSCSSFQLALKIAASMMRADERLTSALLFAEDRVPGSRVNFPSHIVGDGASAVVLTKGSAAHSIVDMEYKSIGGFHSVAGTNLPGRRAFDAVEFERQIVPVHYRVIWDLVSRVLSRNALALGDVGLILYQNMSLGDYDGLVGTMRLDRDRVYEGGLKGHGHIFGSDLVINYCMARDAGRLSSGEDVLLISSGAGFAWGVTLLKT